MTPKTDAGGVKIVNADGNNKQHRSYAKPHQTVDHLLLLLYGVLQEPVFIRQRLYSSFKRPGNILNGYFYIRLIDLASKANSMAAMVDSLKLLSSLPLAKTFLIVLPDG